MKGPRVWIHNPSSSFMYKHICGLTFVKTQTYRDDNVAHVIGLLWGLIKPMDLTFLTYSTQCNEFVYWVQSPSWLYRQLHMMCCCWWGGIQGYLCWPAPWWRQTCPPASLATARCILAAGYTSCSLPGATLRELEAQRSFRKIFTATSLPMANWQVRFTTPLTALVNDVPELESRKQWMEGPDGVCGQLSLSSLPELYSLSTRSN